MHEAWKLFFRAKFFAPLVKNAAEQWLDLFYPGLRRNSELIRALRGGIHYARCQRLRRRQARFSLQIDIWNLYNVRTQKQFCITQRLLPTPQISNIEKPQISGIPFYCVHALGLWSGLNPPNIWTALVKKKRTRKSPRGWKCSKMPRIWRKNPLKLVVSHSQDYWVYFDITWNSSTTEFEFWGKFEESETFSSSNLILRPAWRNWFVRDWIGSKRAKNHDTLQQARVPELG